MSKGAASKRILVVDDDYDFVQSMQAALISEGHVTASASNGRDAAVAYSEFSPELVLLDVVMPGIGGLETFQRIMEVDPGARVVITSGYAIDEQRYAEARIRNLCGMLPKPITLASLRRAIKAHSK